jgi:membrane fusion protein (multidrug efflux system)
MLALGIAALVLGGWGAWFVLARVSRYEVTDLARLEVDREIHVVQAPLAGRIVSSALVLDREVKAGDVLAEIESEEHRLRIQEENARVAVIGPQIRALASEAASQERAQSLERRASEVAVEQARAAVREAETVASAANQELARLQRLHAQGLIPERDLERGKGDAENRRATVEKLALSAGHIESEQRRNETDREARMRRLRGEITVLEGQQRTIAKGIDRLRYEVKRRRILAPIDGRLGEVAVLREGGYVEEGTKLGAVVPRGRLRVCVRDSVRNCGCTDFRGRNTAACARKSPLLAARFVTGM